jgi:CRISPR-associated protein Cmr6
MPPFCPLYENARNANLTNAANLAAYQGHLGLLYDKFGDQWNRDNPDHRLDFQKPTWVRKLHGRRAGDARTIMEACSRQRTLISKLNVNGHVKGEVLYLRNVDRFVSGLGRQHPVENGFTWHHSLGVPYLPGSSVKGMLRAWLPNCDAPKDKIVQLLGEAGLAGQAIFFDVLPSQPTTLVADVMTPHYSPYYQSGEIPGDWHSPIPIPFLTVAKSQTWQCAVVAPEQDCTLLVGWLKEAFQYAGAGAKTALGYGRFEDDPQGLGRAEQADRFAADQEDAAAQEDQRRHQMRNASADLRKLLVRKTPDWDTNRTAGNEKMMGALNDFLDGKDSLAADCLQWLRDWIEGIQGYKGVWDNPGNEKKYKSGRIRNLVISAKSKT